MKFSSLITNYNNGKFFKNCYDSLLAPTYPYWETILDDGSTDNSREIIKHMIETMIVSGFCSVCLQY